MSKCPIFFFIYIHDSVHRNSILIRSNKMQQYAGVYFLRYYDLQQRLQLQFYVLLTMDAMDTRNMQSDFAVNKCLHTVASCWILLIYMFSVCCQEFNTYNFIGSVISEVDICSFIAVSYRVLSKTVDRIPHSPAADWIINFQITILLLRDFLF